MILQPKIIYDETGDVEKARTLKGKALQLYTHAVNEPLSKDLGSYTRFYKTDNNKVRIRVDVVNDAYMNRTGTVTVWVQPGISDEEIEYAGFLFRNPLVGDTVDYYAHTSTKGWQEIEETDKKGTLNYWHGKKETVCWSDTHVYMMLEEVIDGQAVKNYGQEVQMGLATIVYAFTRRKDGYLVVFYKSGSYIGLKLYRIADIDKLAVSQTAVYTNANFFPSLQHAVAYQILVNKSANQLVAIGKISSTPSNQLPAGVIVPTFPNYDTGIYGFDVYPAGLGVIDKNAWNSVLTYSIGTVTEDNELTEEWIGLSSTEHQYIKHIWKMTREDQSSTVDNNQDSYTNLGRISNLCSGGVRYGSPGSYIYASFYGESYTYTQKGQTSTSQTNINYEPVYTGVVKTKAYIQDGAIVFETMQTSVTKTTNNIFSKTTTTTGMGQTFVGVVYNFWDDPYTGYQNGPYKGAYYGGYLSVNVDDVVSSNERHEGVIFNCSLNRANYSISEQYTYQRDCIVTSTTSTTWIPETYSCQPVSDYNPNDTGTYAKNETAGYYEVETTVSQTVSSSCYGKTIITLCGTNNYVKEIVTKNDVYESESTPVTYTSLAAVEAIYQPTKSQTTRVEFDSMNNKIALSPSVDSTSSIYDSFKWKAGVGSSKTAYMVNYSYSNDDAMIGGGSPSGTYPAAAESYFCLWVSKDSKQSTNSPVLLATDRIGNSIYAYKNTEVTPNESGNIIYKKDFAAEKADKQTEVDLIVDDYNNVIGVI